MSGLASKITLDEWDQRYQSLKAAGLREPAYGGPLRRHVEAGDTRLSKLRLDNSPAALRLWNFLLTEEDRLRHARSTGHKIIGTMKDLGTVPVLAYAFDNLTTFYPDGAWWIPCVMERQAGLLEIADRLGIDDSFCPVRALLGAFVNESHFPTPDLLICSVGAICDDLSAVAQRLASLGHEILWWEVPHRHRPDGKEKSIRLPGGMEALDSHVSFVRGELERIRTALEQCAGKKLGERDLRDGIRRANQVRNCLYDLRHLVYCAPACPLPALEMLIAEMLAIHFCSDQNEALVVLRELMAEAERRVHAEECVLPRDAVRVFWVNPVADIRAMNMLEDAGGRVCGTEYLFSHALDRIPEDLPPLEALARMALADPMVGSPVDRARRICHDVKVFRSEAVVISSIPGASHCALEGTVIGDVMRQTLGVPVLEIEVPPLTDAMEPTLRTRLEALVETVREQRRL